MSILKAVNSDEFDSLSQHSLQNVPFSYVSLLQSINTDHNRYFDQQIDNMVETLHESWSYRSYSYCYWRGCKLWNVSAVPYLSFASQHIFTKLLPFNVFKTRLHFAHRLSLLLWSMQRNCREFYFLTDWKRQRAIKSNLWKSFENFWQSFFLSPFTSLQPELRW